MAKAKLFLKLIDFINNEQNLSGLFRYNLMTKDIEFTRKVEIEDWNHTDFLTDEDLIHLKYYIAKILDEEFDKAKIAEAMIMVAKRRKYHPLLKYLDNLKWDGTNRLDTWLFDVFGVKKDAYTRAVGRKILCGAIARAYTPGTKFDYMLILEGDQGIGKSTAVEILGGKWYLDTFLHGSNNKSDLVNIMRTAWITEISDMAGFRKTDIEFLKSFITRKVDRIRLPYDRLPQDLPRQCILIGTHNPSGNNEYFRDDTGNRRFWPIECKKANTAKLIEIRDQLFAEAIVRLNDGEKLYIDEEDDEVKTILINMQNKRQITNPLNCLIKEFVSDKVRVTNIEILRDAFECSLGRMSDHESRSKKTTIGIWMREHKWEKDGEYYIKPKYKEEELTNE